MTSGQVSYRPRGHGLTFNLASVRGLIIAVTTVFRRIAISQAHGEPT
jgi:hypothetical protein